MGLLGLSGVIFMPILLRRVDAEIMATVLVAQVFVYYLLLVVQFGFNWSSPAAFARAGSHFEAASVWYTSIRIKAILLIIPAFLLSVFGYLHVGHGAIYLFGFAMLLSATAVNSNWLLQARSDFVSGVVFTLGGVLASTFLIYCLAHDVFLLNSFLNGLGVVLVLILPASFLGFGSWFLSKRIFQKDASKFSNIAWYRSDNLLLWTNTPLVITQLLQLVSATLGTVVVSGLSDVVTTNAYAAMERLFNLSASVVVALYMASYPRLAAQFYDNRTAYWNQVCRLLKIGGTLALTMFVLFALFGETLLTIYVSEPLAVKVTPVMLTFTLWFGLYLSQHVLTGYFVFAQRNGMALWANALILFVTAVVGYSMARHEPVLWVYGMLAGQVVATIWLIRLYRQDACNSASHRNDAKLV